MSLKNYFNLVHFGESDRGSNQLPISYQLERQGGGWNVEIGVNSRQQKTSETCLILIKHSFEGLSAIAWFLAAVEEGKPSKYRDLL